MLNDKIFNDMALDESDASEHPNGDNLRLIIIRGTTMMDLVHALYAREAWRRDYNEVRPHSAIGNKPPIALMNNSPVPSPV